MLIRIPGIVDASQPPAKRNSEYKDDKAEEAGLFNRW